MKPIPNTYSANGYDYKLHSRVGNVAIYEQYHRVAGLAAYEVVKIRRGNGIAGQDGTREAVERMPSNAEWGIRGFTYSLFGSADGAANALEAAKAQMAYLLCPKNKKPSNEATA